MLIDGKTVSSAIIERIRVESAALRETKGIQPGLAVILVGDDPASSTYVASKGRMCGELGFHSVTRILPSETTEQELLGMIDEFNNDPAIHGILVQLPLPAHIDTDRVVEAISPAKDVDGFHPM